MTNSPAISVIIPVYNTAPWLRRCLDSVCGQTLRDIEIICVNDGSSDESGEILSEYAASDTRVLPITLASNQGVSVARNIGMTAAHSKWCGFVDSDDTIDQDFYATLYLKAIQSYADMIEAPICIEDNIGVRENLQWTWFYSSLFKIDFLRKNNIYFPIEFSNSQDVVFIARVLLSLPSREKVGDVAYHYHQISTSASHHLSEKKSNTILSAYELIFSEIMQHVMERTISYEYAESIFCIFFQHLISLISFRFHDNAKRNASIMLIKLYTTYPYIGKINYILSKTDQFLLSILKQGDMDKLTDFFLTGMRRLAKKLRINIKQRTHLI